MLQRFLKLLAVLVPLALFALALQPVQQLMYGGRATQGILLLLVSLVVLAVLEGLLFRYWILPGWSEKMAERLYAGSYLPQEDALAQLIDRIDSGKDASLLPQLEQLVRSQKWRVRGWLELARLQWELAHDVSAALRIFEEAVSAVSEQEDLALLMYRAARLCEKSQPDSAASRRWLQRAADMYPGTVYGRRAAARLK